MSDKFLGTITQSGDYGEKRKTSFHPNKECISTLRTTIQSEGGSYWYFMKAKAKTTAKPKLAGSLHKYNFGQADNVWSVDGVCPTILAHLQGQIGHQINILEIEDDGTPSNDTALEHERR